MSSVNRVLFDAPGPRARRRIAVATGVSVLALLALVVLALVQLGHHGQLDGAKWQVFFTGPIMRFLFGGLGVTLGIAAVSAVISLPFGAVLALCRLSSNAALRWPATAFIEFFRSVPLLVIVYIFLLAIPKSGYTFPVFWELVIPIVLCSTAVFAEIFRAGVQALDSGQAEAAKAIGMRGGQVMWIIVLPQAVRLVVPTLVSQMVSVLKDSCLGYVVSLNDLLNQAKVLGSYYHLFFQPYLLSAVIYILINAAISQLAHAMERRSHRVRRTRGADAGAEGGPGAGVGTAFGTQQLRAGNF